MLSTEKNESYCANLTNDIEKKYCKEYIEEKMNCELLEKDQKEYCMALTKKDIKYCEEIESIELKSYCAGEIGLIIAILNNDEKGCEDIPQEWLGDYCIAWINGEKEICAKRAPSVDVDEQKTQLAVKTGNEMICYTINKTKEKEICILEFAVKDSSLCDEIFTSDIKKACTAIINKQKNICEEVQDERAKIICQGNAQN
jgi:hypothetical protein